MYKYLSYLLSKCFSNLLPGLQVKPKFQTVTFFPDTNHGRGSIGDTFTANISLVPSVWTKIHRYCKNLYYYYHKYYCSYIYYYIFEENICYFYNLQCSFSYNFNSLTHLWDRVLYSYYMTWFFNSEYHCWRSVSAQEKNIILTVKQSYQWLLKNCASDCWRILQTNLETKNYDDSLHSLSVRFSDYLICAISVP